MKKARLQKRYQEEIAPKLQSELKLKNVMEIPKISKIVLNVGVKDAVSDSKILQKVKDTLTGIAGQMPAKTLAKKSIASFKLREGMPIGVMVTLRNKNMYEFLDKFITLALPKVRDFQGIPTKFDGRGNYNLGIKDWTIFPEVEFGAIEKTSGLNVTFHTTAPNDVQAYELLKSFGMPFRKA